MKKNGLSALFGLLAAVFALLAVVLTVAFLNAGPVVMKVPEAAVETADSFMAAVCEGDYESAQQLLDGNPDLGAGQMQGDSTGMLIWEAYLDSMDYRLEGECRAEESGIVQDVRFLRMDLTSVTDHLGERARKLLEQKVAQAEDPSEIYGEDNNYRPELVEAVLNTVTREALLQDAEYTERAITLKLTCRDGVWYVVPEQQLLNALFGGIG